MQESKSTFVRYYTPATEEHRVKIERIRNEKRLAKYHAKRNNQLNGVPNHD